MAKRITAKIGTYMKDGGQKGKYVNIGVILNNDNGEYILFDPSVNMAGIAFLQSQLPDAKPNSTSVIASIFTDEPREGGQQASQATQGAQAGQQGSTNMSGGDFDQDIPFISMDKFSIV